MIPDNTEAMMSSFHDLRLPKRRWRCGEVGEGGGGPYRGIFRDPMRWEQFSPQYFRLVVTPYVNLIFSSMWLPTQVLSSYGNSYRCVPFRWKLALDVEHVWNCLNNSLGSHGSFSAITECNDGVLGDIAMVF